MLLNRLTLAEFSLHIASRAARLVAPSPERCVVILFFEHRNLASRAIYATPRRNLERSVLGCIIITSFSPLTRNMISRSESLPTYPSICPFVHSSSGTVGSTTFPIFQRIASRFSSSSCADVSRPAIASPFWQRSSLTKR